MAMTKAKMMATMADRIRDEEDLCKAHEAEVIKLYNEITGASADSSTDCCTRDFERWAMEVIRSMKNYNPDTKYDIQYHSEWSRQAHSREYGLRSLFEELFGISVYKYRKSLSKETA